MIKEGAYVTHIDKMINNGLMMEVLEVDGEKAHCSLINGSKWFDKSELILVKESPNPYI